MPLMRDLVRTLRWKIHHEDVAGRGIAESLVRERPSVRRQRGLRSPIRVMGDLPEIRAVRPEHEDL